MACPWICVRNPAYGNDSDDESDDGTGDMTGQNNQLGGMLDSTEQQAKSMLPAGLLPGETTSGTDGLVPFLPPAITSSNEPVPDSVFQKIYSEATDRLSKLQSLAGTSPDVKSQVQEAEQELKTVSQLQQYTGQLKSFQGPLQEIQNTVKSLSAADGATADDGSDPVRATLRKTWSSVSKSLENASQDISQATDGVGAVNKNHLRVSILEINKLLDSINQQASGGAAGGPIDPAGLGGVLGGTMGKLGGTLGLPGTGGPPSQHPRHGRKDPLRDVGAGLDSATGSVGKLTHGAVSDVGQLGHGVTQDVGGLTHGAVKDVGDLGTGVLKGLGDLTGGLLKGVGDLGGGVVKSIEGLGSGIVGDIERLAHLNARKKHHKKNGAVPPPMAPVGSAGMSSAGGTAGGTAAGGGPMIVTMRQDFGEDVNKTGQDIGKEAGQIISELDKAIKQIEADLRKAAKSFSKDAKKSLEEGLKWARDAEYVEPSGDQIMAMQRFDAQSASDAHSHAAHSDAAHSGGISHPIGADSLTLNADHSHAHSLGHDLMTTIADHSHAHSLGHDKMATSHSAESRGAHSLGSDKKVSRGLSPATAHGLHTDNLVVMGDHSNAHRLATDVVTAGNAEAHPHGLHADRMLQHVHDAAHAHHLSADTKAAEHDKRARSDQASK